jgi:hypothetical protein
MATISLIFGIVSYFGLFFIGAAIAIVCGHMARAEIRRSQGALDGDGLAITGLVLGYLHLAIFLLVVVAIVLFFGGLAAFLAVAAHHQ